MSEVDPLTKPAKTSWAKRLSYPTPKKAVEEDFSTPKGQVPVEDTITPQAAEIAPETKSSTVGVEGTEGKSDPKSPEGKKNRRGGRGRGQKEAKDVPIALPELPKPVKPEPVKPSLEKDFPCLSPEAKAQAKKGAAWGPKIEVSPVEASPSPVRKASLEGVTALKPEELLVPEEPPRPLKWSEMDNSTDEEEEETPAVIDEGVPEEEHPVNIQPYTPDPNEFPSLSPGGTVPSTSVPSVWQSGKRRKSLVARLKGWIGHHVPPHVPHSMKPVSPVVGEQVTAAAVTSVTAATVNAVKTAAEPKTPTNKTTDSKSPNGDKTPERRRRRGGRQARLRREAAAIRESQGEPAAPRQPREPGAARQPRVPREPREPGAAGEGGAADADGTKKPRRRGGRNRRLGVKKVEPTEVEVPQK